MSGGSLGYLFCREPEELLCATQQENMEAAEQILLCKGYKDIARDVRRLIEYTRSAENRIAVLHAQLKGVFRAIEWWESGDTGNESLVKSLEAYREGKEG